MSEQQPSDSIGTELLFENESIRVWSMILAPGEVSPYHIHKLDYVFVYTTPSRIALMQKPGEVTEIREFGDGYVSFNVVGDGLTHQIRNEGTDIHRQILVEFKDSPSARTSATNLRLSEVIGTE